MSTRSPAVHFRSLLAVSTAAIVLGIASACGTILNIEADPPTTEDAAPVADGGPIGAGDGSTDAPADAALAALELEGIAVTLESTPVDVLVGAQKSFTVRVTRPAGNTTPVVVEPQAVPAAVLDISPIAPITAAAASATITPTANAAPQRITITLAITVGSSHGELDLVVRVARDYRRSGDAFQLRTFNLTSPQTFTIAAWGAGGGAPKAGAGGFVEGDVAVPANTDVNIVIGLPGESNALGGMPGGGNGGVSTGSQRGGGGGGYSGVFFGTPMITNAKIVAGAGGGASANLTGVQRPGGAGGSAGTGTAGNGVGPNPGLGGGSMGGDAGSLMSTKGLDLRGGAGETNDYEPGGGGGAGYHGGGGGGVASGGGGGGSFVPTGGTSMPGSGQLPGNMSDPRRGTAGDPGAAGAVILTPK